MESYVIRIYRRSDAGEPTVVGTLEAIATGKRSAFHSRAELVAMVDAEIIEAKPARTVRSGKNTTVSAK